MESVTWYDCKRTLRSKDMPLEFLSKDKDIVLLLQGGGALGAYQVGAFKALATACAWAKNRIAWVAGISIGAINAAVISAPKNEGAVEELQSLWNDILAPEAPPFDYLAPIKEWFPKAEESWFVGLDGRYLDWMWLSFNPWGHAHFFSSRLTNPLLNPWLQQWVRKLGCDEFGFYGTQRLTDTLNKHVNWEGLEDRKSTLLSLGATRVCDGEVKFFHSWETKLEADHVRASGALPPAFPPVQIGPDWYFDGGVSTNTPIEALARDLSHQKKNT